MASAQVCAYVWTATLPGRDAWRPACVLSERDGHYRIEGLRPVRHRVTASAANYVPGLYVRGDGTERVEAVELRPATESRGIDLVLESGGVEVRGVVRDLSGGPIEGAQLITERAFTRSDTGGAFALWVRPGILSVVAEAEGYAASNVEGIAPGHTFELFLTPEAVLVGKVVRGQSGEPIAGAMVKSGAQEWGGNQAAFTDLAGNFRIAGLEPGVYKPSVEADDARGSATEQVVLGMGETGAPIVIEAHPAYTVEGRVVVSGGGGCHNGWLSLTARASGKSIYASVEGDGNLRVPAVLPDTYAVALGCDGYLAEESYGPITVADGSLLGLTWSVARGQAIRGKVVDQTGKPVGGVDVRAIQRLDPARPRSRQTWTRATTNSDGRFDLGGLTAGQFDVSVDGHRATSEKPLTVALNERQDLEDVRIELPAAGEVRGTVLDEFGRAIPRSTASLSGGPKEFGTMVADDGSFKIEHVAEGTYRVSAFGRAGELRPPASDRLTTHTVTVEAGKIATVRLTVETSSGTISGSVRDPDGGALNDAFVESVVEDPDEESSRPAMRGTPWGDFFGPPSLTDADGRFSMKGLPSAKYTIRAYRKAGGEGFVRHVEPGADVVVTIAPTGRLTGVIHVPKGPPPEDFSLEVSNTTTGLLRRDSFFRAGGKWSLPELPAGRYKIRVRSGSATAESEAVVREGEDTTDVSIELTPNVLVRGSVIDQAGAPLAGVQVLMRPTQGGPSAPLDATRRHVTDTLGRFELADVPTGDIEIVLVVQGAGGNGADKTTKVRMHLPSTNLQIELEPIRLPQGGP